MSTIPPASLDRVAVLDGAEPALPRQFNLDSTGEPPTSPGGGQLPARVLRAERAPPCVRALDRRVALAGSAPAAPESANPDWPAPRGTRDAEVPSTLLFVVSTATSRVMTGVRTGTGPPASGPRSRLERMRGRDPRLPGRESRNRSDGETRSVTAVDSITRSEKSWHRQFLPLILQTRRMAKGDLVISSIGQPGHVAMDEDWPTRAESRSGRRYDVRGGGTSGSMASRRRSREPPWPWVAPASCLPR